MFTNLGMRVCMKRLAGKRSTTTDKKIPARDEAMTDGSSYALAYEIFSVVLRLGGRGDGSEAGLQSQVDQVCCLLPLPCRPVYELLLGHVCCAVIVVGSSRLVA